MIPFPTNHDPLTLEGEIQAIVLLSQPRLSHRNYAIAAQVLGWDGTGGTTLQTVASKRGITRERVRQISAKATLFLWKTHALTPVLDRVLAKIHSTLPATVDSICDLLKAEGLTRECFALEGIQTFCSQIGRSPSFSIVDDKFGTSLAVAIDHEFLPALISSLARKSVAKLGVSSTSMILAGVSAAGVNISEEVLKRVLENQDGFSWLDKDNGWFWLRNNARNRLTNSIRKIFSVAARIHIAELRTGVSRNYRTQGFAPPRAVLLEFCRQLGDYLVEDQMVIATHPTPFALGLGNVERLFALILRNHGFIMQRQELERECMERGVNQSTFYVYLDNSPILVRYARGVYGLRGAPLAPGVVASLIPPVKRTRPVSIDSGWVDTRTYRCTYRISKGMVRSGVVSIPSGLSQILDGQYSGFVLNGLHVGEFAVRGPSGWSFTKVFRRYGGDEGDILKLLFEPTSRKLHIEIRDEESLLEGTSP